MNVNNTLYTAASVRELDRLTIEEFDVPGYELMQRAAQSVYQQLVQHYPQAKSLLVLCGAGNNAGDGYGIARLAIADGKCVQVLTLVPTERLKGDAATAAKDYLAQGGQIEDYSTAKIKSPDVIVDALLGTGLDRDVGGIWAECIQSINQLSKPIIAVDIPSGLHADTGKVMGHAINADITVSFIGRKQGLATGQAKSCAGQVYFDNLEVPEQVYERVAASAQSMKSSDFNDYLLPRDANSHKGLFGHALLIGGDHGYSGALQMSGMAALRTGAGLVSLATRERHAALISTAQPELMSQAVEDLSSLLPMLKKASVIGIGPGLGQQDWGQLLLSRVMQADLPQVMDADALNLLAQNPNYSEKRILTPHPGEAARLLNVSNTEIQADRFSAIRDLQEKYGGVVVLKGSGSLVIDEEKEIHVCESGNPGMATGGMGDILTGIITALVAQKLPLGIAACLGVCVHAEAADMAVKKGERGLIATDLLKNLRVLLNPDV